MKLKYPIFFIIILFVLVLVRANTEHVNLLVIKNNWSIFNIPEKININNVTIPMSVTTALKLNKLIDEPLFRFNDIKLRWIANDDNWIFENKFQINDFLLKTNAVVYLILESIDSIASVYLNNRFILSASNQFLNYQLRDIGSFLVTGANTLQVKFKSPIKYANYLSLLYPYDVPPMCPPDVQNGECHVNMLRKQQCSFSWDWGPSFAPIGLNGNVKLMFIENFDFNITMSVYNANKKDLESWTIDVDLGIKMNYDNMPAKSLATVKIAIDEIAFSHSSVYHIEEIKDKLNIRILLATKNNIELWWPNGYGKQKLYNLTVEVDIGDKKLIKTKTFGFRKVELVQEELQDGLSFYFKINNIPIFLKGSNWIPANSFQELITEEYLVWLLKSTRDANMNVLRVWGGGIYESTRFYELANEYGIMIWQDFMFACATYPTNEEFLNNVRSEVDYQVNRLKHHPSIIIWSGNNENEAAISANWYGTDNHKDLYENDYRKLYIDTIMRIVVKIDSSRPFLSSSPTNGLESMKENWLAKNPYDLRFGDLHFYDYKMNGWEANSFPIPRFMSEYGVQSFPSYATLADAYLMPEDAKIWGDLNQHRQHHEGGNQQIINQIENNLILPNSSDFVKNFQSIIYLSQLNQAMTYKTASELFRRNMHNTDKNCMGTMYWQLNDVWQAPTWSSIEFSGKWKLAHYFVQNAYKPLLISPILNETHLNIFAISDLNSIVYNNFSLKVYLFESFTPQINLNINFEMNALESKIVKTFSLDSFLKKSNCEAKKCLIETALSNESSEKNFMLMSNKIVSTDLFPTNVRVVHIEKLNSKSFSIQIDSDAIALFVYLDMNTTMFYGSFSNNGFHMTEPSVNVLYQVYNSDSIQVYDIKKYLTLTSLFDIY